MDRCPRASDVAGFDKSTIENWLQLAAASLQTASLIEILIGTIKEHRRHRQPGTNAKLLFFLASFAVVAQYFEVQVYDQFAIRGNAAIFKCQVPSFVADHVDVVGWIDSNGGSYVADAQSYGSKNWRDARCALSSLVSWKIVRAQITERENWIDRPGYSILHALPTISFFSLMILRIMFVWFKCVRSMRCMQYD